MEPTEDMNPTDAPTPKELLYFLVGLVILLLVLYFGSMIALLLAVPWGAT